MGFSKESYKQAFETVANNKLRAENEAKKRVEKIFNDVPQLRELDKRISETGLAAVKAATALNGIASLVKFRDNYIELTKQYDMLLAEHGLSQADFEPKYSCTLCNDSGRVDGKVCNCVKSIAQKIEFGKLCNSMPLESSTFDSFELRYYTGEARDVMKSVYDRCVLFADRFGDGTAGLVFFGKTGVGKTHLSLAIANEVLKKGYGVIYGSSQNLLEKVEREHFGKAEGNTLEMLRECDLLIIDDLGAEFQTQFTISAIYNILNSRIMQNKPTVISTNCSPAEMEKAYGERIVSRIIGNLEPLKFEGSDIRQLKRMESLKKK